jgi:hypothetical protein
LDLLLREKLREKRLEPHGFFAPDNLNRLCSNCRESRDFHALFSLDKPRIDSSAAKAVLTFVRLMSRLKPRPQTKSNWLQEFPYRVKKTAPLKPTLRNSVQEGAAPNLRLG